MTSLRRIVPALCAVLLTSHLAAAQTYVGASIGADIAKSYRSETDGQAFPDGGSEALSWGLRLGMSLGSRWGVELEFNRPGEIELGNGPVYPLIDSRTTSALLGSTTALGGLSLVDLIAYTPRLETSQRNTTWNALVWVTQPIGARADLAFMGGVGFSHVVQNAEFNISSIPATTILPFPRSFRTTTTAYGVGPVVGVEARIRMTDHLGLTPGFRAQSLGNSLTSGIVLRPSVALGWTF